VDWSPSAKIANKTHKGRAIGGLKNLSSGNMGDYRPKTTTDVMTGESEQAPGA
jgi:hypothetical protein